MSNEDVENLLSQIEEYKSKLNIQNPSEETKKSQDMMKKKLEGKIDSLIEETKKKLILSQKPEIDKIKDNLDNIKNPLKEKMDELNTKLDTVLPKLKDEEKLNETENTAHVSTEELKEQERIMNAIRNNVNQSNQNIQAYFEGLSQRIEQLKKIKEIIKNNKSNLDEKKKKKE